MNAFGDIGMIAEKAILSYFSGICLYLALQTGLVDYLCTLMCCHRTRGICFVHSRGWIGHMSDFCVYIDFVMGRSLVKETLPNTLLTP